MSTLDLNAQAHRALQAWGGTRGPAKLISERENAVLEVRLNDGVRAVLRLHRPGYNARDEIEAELWWMAALAGAGFQVPPPIRNQGGDLSTRIGKDRIATVIGWAAGTPIGASGAPLPGTGSAQVATYRRIGAMLADLHDRTDALIVPEGFRRRRWDRDGFLGDAPHWGRFWENPTLNPHQRALILAAREAADAELAEYANHGADYGLIHADALRENVFASDRGLTLIDFDDCGFGYRIYDLTTAISQSIGDANYRHLRDALIGGYTLSRRLEDRDIAMMPLFAMLRTFASLGWVMPRMRADDPQVPRYAGRAVTAAEEYLEQR